MCRSRKPLEVIMKPTRRRKRKVLKQEQNGS